jgi:hypothetical protein
MPALALPVDWGAARALFVHGLDVHKIAEKLGINHKAVQKRADRGGWHKEREEAQSLLMSSPGRKESTSPIVSKGVEIATSLLVERKNSFLETTSAIINDCVKATQAHVKQGLPLKKLSQIGSVTESFVRSARPVFGLDAAAQVSVGVQLNVLSELPADAVLSPIDPVEDSSTLK